jgi:predicted nucleic acid-binding protein
MRSISDSNTLIGLAKGEVFPVLRELYGEIVVPQAVWDEVVTSGAGRFGAAEAMTARDEGWLLIQDPGNPGASTDETVLSLALELQGRLLTSDRQLSFEAASLGVPVVDCTEVVLFACLDGLIPSCRAVFDRMQARGFGIRDAARLTILRLAGEA